MIRPWLLVPALLSIAAAAPTAASPASTVGSAARACGVIAVGGRHFDVKASGLTCSKGRYYAVRYLSKGRRPPYYKCYRYSGGSIKFRCIATRYEPDRAFWAIRR